MQYTSSESAAAVILSPTAPATASVIWLHGLGADGFDFVPIVPELRLPDTLPVRFVFPHAQPRPVTLNNGYVMRAWYDILGLGPGRQEDEAGIRGALEGEATAIGPDRMHRRLAELDPVAASKIEPGNVRRTVRALEVAAITGRTFSSFAVAWDRYGPERVRAAGVRLGTQDLVARVDARVQEMLAAGWMREVEELMARGLGGWLTASRAIGYAELARHLAGELSLEDAVQQTVKRTRSLARRQMAWFRRDPRIRWFDVGIGGAVEATAEIASYLEGA